MVRYGHDIGEMEAVKVSTCSFIKLDGGRCKNMSVGDKSFCHLETHTTVKSKSNKTKVDKMMAFEKEYLGRTLAIEDYELYDVLADDACLFRSLSLGIFTEIKNIKFSKEILRIFTHPETKLEEGHIHLSDETVLADTLQEMARKWIIVNRDRELESCGGETVNDIVLHTHELSSLEEYASLYSIPARMINKAYNDKSELVHIESRWGGFPEEVALSDMFEMDISVYVPRRVNWSSDGVVSSFGLKAGTRFEIYTDIRYGGDREGKYIPKVELLLVDKLRKPHYQLMIPLEP